VNPPIVVPRPAATVILARDTSDGIEVFMMQRTTEVAFAKGMHVFPGGGIDPTDHHDEIASLCVGLTDDLKIELDSKNMNVSMVNLSLQDFFKNITYRTDLALTKDLHIFQVK
jgi:hypothetical protein